MVDWWGALGLKRGWLWVGCTVIFFLAGACQDVPVGAGGQGGVCLEHTDCGSGLRCERGLCVKGSPSEDPMAEIDVEPADSSEQVTSEPADELPATEPSGESQPEPATDGEPDAPDGGGQEPTPEIGPEAGCREGATRTCYSGAAATLGVGACKEGTQTCSGGKWGTCEGEVLPAQSDTCGNGIDENCDGATDEGCPCHYLGKSQGVCLNATNDAAGMCQAPPDYSDTEDCNDNLDNNCDGSANEGCVCTGQETRKCGSDVGECQKGTQQCDSGNWSSLCKGEKKPEATDKCDGKDNDCDGVIDENCPCHYKGLNKGVCLTAKRDAAGFCQPPQGYKDQEICGDAIDNNCDSKVDEFCPCRYLGLAKGVCATARRDSSGVCQKPSRYDPTEKCDSVDNDCDGAIDEGCPCNYLNKNAGVCLNRRRNAKGECSKPSSYDPEEQCGDLRDNNCDGLVDIFPSNALCLSYAHKCSINGVSPPGPRDICIQKRPYCAGFTKKCNPSYYNTCESYKNAVKCQSDAGCTKCNAEVGGAKFRCAKNLCMRTSQ